ncbi:hypothetical protein ACFC06_26755 [Nocardia sp. NPDC056064]|uniref:hypothetical protein n=1 Tax=Nocardia sp. NPDC056064 TaxID=3345701 RepID=UPI0035E078C6
MTATPATMPRTPHRRVAEHPYRSLVHFNSAHGTSTLITQEFETWLSEKHWSIAVHESGHFEDADRSLAVVRHTIGDTELLRLRLVEHHTTGAWTTELTAACPGNGPGWILLEVGNDTNHRVATPRIAPRLLGVLPVVIGDAQLTNEPHLVNSNAVTDLAERVTDPDRHGLIFVAASDDQLDFDKFRQRLARWSSDLTGQAEVAILDPLATRRFAEELGDEHTVAPWSLRTFLPGADPAVAEDHRRHRFLTPDTLGSLSDAAIARMLGRIARRHGATRELPSDIRKQLRTLDRVENKLVVDSLTPATVDTSAPPSSPPQPVVATFTPTPTPVEPEPAPTIRPDSADSTVTALVREIFGLEIIDRASLEAIRRRSSVKILPEAVERTTRLLEQRRNDIELLQDQISELREEIADAQLEACIEVDERQRLSDEVRRLQRELVDRKAADIAYRPLSDSEVTAYPESCAELLTWFKRIEDDGVFFTGKPDLCRALDEHDQLGIAARNAWEAALVLADYLRARRDGEHRGNVHEYLRNTPAGYRTVTMKRHASHESDSTMNRFGKERDLPVPDSVSATRRAQMQAHFRLANNMGMVGPRLHYLDNWNADRRVYIGYIGRHLTTSQTN